MIGDTRSSHLSSAVLRLRSLYVVGRYQVPYSVQQGVQSFPMKVPSKAAGLTMTEGRL